MYHVLTILLHRPFVADGHLYSTSRSVPVNSFLACVSAADSIVALLRAYDRAFSVRHAPYLISYATYVAATIHVRIAARRSAGSEARDNLETCLGVFRDNQKTNWAVRRAKTIVEGLIKRLGVHLSDSAEDGGAASRDEARPPQSSSDHQTRRAADGSSATRGSTTTRGLSHGNMESLVLAASDTTSPSTGWSDIDGIIQSFGPGRDACRQDTLGGLEQVEIQEAQQNIHMTTAGPDLGGVCGNQMGSSADVHQDGDGNSASWVGFLPYGNASGATASFEDLLFGFNSSVVDSSFY